MNLLTPEAMSSSNFRTNDTNFFEHLTNRVIAISSLLCVGLDPHQSQLNEYTAAAAVDFCLRIIERTAPYAAAFKPNAAFFEALGSDGVSALKQVIAAVPHDIPVILDVKRCDISSTADAYATSCYDYYNADCVTLSPYMGWDSISPFVTAKYHNKGAFILCKTSNLSSCDIQDIRDSDNCRVFLRVANKIRNWNDECDVPCLGIVAGATDPKALQIIRDNNQHDWILCPGVGAQGGSIKKVCQAALRRDGSGLLISVSRGISKASDMTKAAKIIRDEINTYREVRMSRSHSEDSSSEKIPDIPIKDQDTLLPYQNEFITLALQQGALLFGSFTLKSGRQSPYFFNAGKFSSGKALTILAQVYAQAIRRYNIEFDVIFGTAYKGIPLATCIGIAYFNLYGESKDIAYNRKEAKDHGEGGIISGASCVGKKVLIVDDVITAGTAIREAVSMLRSKGEFKLVGVAVLLDRQEVGQDEKSKSKSKGKQRGKSAVQHVQDDLQCPVISVVQLNHLIDYVDAEGKLDDSSGNNSNSNSDDDIAHNGMNLLQSIKQYRANYGVIY
jgi:uridine monophosphate synthetase